jgi:hypothetical protein
VVSHELPQFGDGLLHGQRLGVELLGGGGHGLYGISRRAREESGLSLILIRGGFA